MQKSRSKFTLASMMTRISGALDFVAGLAVAAVATAAVATGIALSAPVAGIIATGLIGAAVAALPLATGVSKVRTAKDAETATQIKNGLISPDQAKWKSTSLSRGLARLGPLAGIASMLFIGPLGLIPSAFIIADLSTAHNAVKGQNDAMQPHQANQMAYQGRQQSMAQPYMEQGYTQDPAYYTGNQVAMVQARRGGYVPSHQMPDPRVQQQAQRQPVGPHSAAALTGQQGGGRYGP